MSIDTLNLMNDHRNDLITMSSFSEPFNFEGVEFMGVYDESHMDDHSSKVTANISQRKLTPRILVAEIPTGLVPRTSKITQISTGKEYTLLFTAIDVVGISVLWLY